MRDEPLKLDGFGEAIEADRAVGELEYGPASPAVVLVVERGLAVGWIETSWVRHAQRLGLWELAAGDLVLEPPVTVGRSVSTEERLAKMSSHGTSALLESRPDRQVTGIYRRPICGEPADLVSLAPLTPRISRLLGAAGETAAGRGRKLWLVGGLVRDLLRGTGGDDLDLVTDGPVGSLAKALASSLGGIAKFHGRFETARIDLPDGPHLDLAMSRRERYSHPGALPEVESAPLVEDLRRRDFTVNSMAISLTPPGIGRLVDPYGGRDDLIHRRLRVHHPLSFIEDPTRIFRAARFQHRLGLPLHAGSGRLARMASRQGWIDRLSRPRWLREWRLTFEEPDWVGAMRSLDRCGVLDSLATGLGASGLEWSLIASAEALDRQYGLSRHGGARYPQYHLGWILLLRGAGSRGARSVRRLGLGESYRKIVDRIPKLTKLLVDRLGDPTRQSPRTIHETCRRESDLALIAAAVICGQHHVQRAVSAYFARWSRIAPRITGEDLKRAGLAPGPGIGKALQFALRARLDDPELTVEQELQQALAGVRRLDKA